MDHCSVFMNNASTPCLQTNRAVVQQTDKHRQLGRTLSRSISIRAKRFKESTAGCNFTACAISVSCSLAVLALGLSVLNLYWTLHGTGHGLLNQNANRLSSSERSQNDNEYSQSGHDQVTVPTTQQPTTESNSGHFPRSMAQASPVYAHIMGSNQYASIGQNDPELNCLLTWKKNVSHNVDFHEGRGALIIKRPGFYYVYTQIYFVDTHVTQATAARLNVTKRPMVFLTLRNGKPLMQGASPFKEYSTKYHGGIFELREEDTITVRVPNEHLRISSSGDSSFFGVFMLHSSSLPEQGGNDSQER